MKRKHKIIIVFFGITVLLYVIVYAGFYFFQDHLVFQSKALDKDYHFSFDQKFTEHFIPTDDGETLNALLFKTSGPTKGLILYFHGNANNLQRWGTYAIDFTSLGYDILMVDYRGYGKSTGTPTEENLYRDAQTILQWTNANLEYQKLVIYGRSLGSAVASHLATTKEPDLLILETPFEELNDVLYFFSSHFKFSNKKSLPQIACKKVIFQGTEDGVVPLSSAMKLKPFLNDQDRFVVIMGGSHNNLREFAKYHEALKDALQ